MTEEKPDQVPARVEPMMLAHLAVTGDVAQHREWRQRIEAVLQTRAIDREPNPELKRLLARDRVWQHMRVSGKIGACFTMAFGATWMLWLIPTYAIGWGFGWPAALTYLLPVPLAWKVARKTFERAALLGARDASRTTIRDRWAAFHRAVVRSGAAGFAFGFTLVFLHGLISWFMTPLPTIGQELLWDAIDALQAGLITGGASTLLAPILAQPPTDRQLTG